jgi:hypothetical protein
MATDLKSSSGSALELFRRFPALTVALFNALHCPDLSDKRAAQILGEMKDEGTIESHRLVGNKHYYCTTKEGAKALGIKKWKSLGLKAVIDSITVAAHVVRTGAVIKTKDEIRNSDLCRILFGGDWPSVVPSTLCYRTDDLVFHCIIIDRGKHARRIQKSIEKIFRALEESEMGREFVRQCLYRIDLLTGHEGKAQALRRMKLPHANVTITVVPELGELIRG